MSIDGCSEIEMNYYEVIGRLLFIFVDSFTVNDHTFQKDFIPEAKKKPHTNELT